MADTYILSFLLNSISNVCVFFRSPQLMINDKWIERNKNIMTAANKYADRHEIKSCASANRMKWKWNEPTQRRQMCETIEDVTNKRIKHGTKWEMTDEKCETERSGGGGEPRRARIGWQSRAIRSCDLFSLLRLPDGDFISNGIHASFSLFLAIKRHPLAPWIRLRGADMLSAAVFLCLINISDGALFMIQTLRRVSLSRRSFQMLSKRHWNKSVAKVGRLIWPGQA